MKKIRGSFNMEYTEFDFFDNFFDNEEFSFIKKKLRHF